MILSILAISQDYSFTRLSEEDGLPGDQAYCFLKDDRGFIWIGTSGGLCRYDGYDIKSFNRDMGYDTSDDFVNSIIQDRDGILWVGTNGGGLNRFDPKTETFSAFRHDPDDLKSIAGERIRELAEGEDGIIWIGFDNGIGLSKFDKNTNTSINYDPFESITEPGVKAIRGMVLDRYDPNLLWLGTTSGLIRFDIKKESFKLIDHVLSAVNRYGFFALDQIDENRLIAGFFHAGIDIYHIKEDRWEEVYTNPAEPLRIFDLARKSDTEFWVSARKKGLAIYNVDTKKLTFVPSDLTNQTTPFPGFTYSVYSGDNRVWVGGKYGVSYSNIRELPYPFDSISYSKQEANQIVALSGKHSKIYSLETKSEGVVEIDKVSKKKVIHSLGKGDHIFLQMLEHNDVIYIYDQHRRLFLFDKKEASFTELFLPVVNERKISIVGMHEWTGSHAILLTAYGGAWKLEYGSNKISPLYEPLDLEEWQLDLLILEDSTIWIGGSKGIAQFDPKTGTVTSIGLNTIDSKKEKHVQAIARGRDGVIWFGTTRGLIKLDGGNEILYNVQNSNLAGNVIYQIMIDSEGSLWLNTQNGITKVIPARMEVINYGRSDGIDPEGKLVSLDGEICYVTYGGYFRLTNPLAKEAQPSPKVHLLSFQVNNQSFQSDEAIDYTGKIQLEHWENRISFSFSSPNYNHPEKIQYAYRLSGQDGDWISYQGRRFASYTNLDGGNYTFEVKAKLPEDDWGEVKSVDIHLASPFWETWWWYTLCTVLILTTGFIIYKLRIQAVQRRADMEAQELQLEALKNRFMELHTSPAQLVVQLEFDELNQKLNSPLTEREFEALKLSLEGKTNAEISDLLFISISTVKFHLRNTYSKMGVGNRKEAFQYILRTS